MTKKATKKTTTKKTSSKTAAKKAPAPKPPRPRAKTKAGVDANLKAIAAADQENAKKRDQRAASTDGMTPSERAMAESEADAAKTLEAIRSGNLAEGITIPRSAHCKTKSDAQSDTAGAKRPSGLDLAAEVLAEAGEPLAAKAIAERAIAAGWKTSGKTPHATLYAAIIREISKKGDAARFKKADRGMFVAAGSNAKGGR